MSTQGYFEVIGRDDRTFDFSTIHETLHFSEDRKERHEKIMSIIGGGNVVDAFIVDKRHHNGLEVHTIFDNGIIVIRNKRTNRLIAELIARPQQIKRYYEAISELVPSNVRGIVNKAYQHQLAGYNLW